MGKRYLSLLAPEESSTALINRPVKDVKQATQYLDGLGRPLQTVIKQGFLETGGSSGDIVSPVIYDGYGREQYKYLPFASSETNGGFKTNPFVQQVAFYNTQLTGQTGETYTGSNSLNWAYSKTNFESSPVSRVQNTFAPGSSWVGSEASSSPHAVSVNYHLNTADDAVRLWKVTDNVGTFGSYALNVAVNSGFYFNEMLYKTITTDEHGKQVIEFKDKEGKVILKKVQFTDSGDPGTGRWHGGWLCTYYIYDDQNNLRCVVQPNAVDLMHNSNDWTLNQNKLDEFCFRYEYDARGRMIMKKVPGAGAVWMVYDDRDRLVLTQDANMRSAAKKQWMYTTYDDFNRPVSTGLITDPANYTNLIFHTTAAAGQATYPDLNNYSTKEELTKTFYDSYTWLSAYDNPLSSSYDNAYNTYFQTLTGNWPYAQGNTATTNLLGMATGSRIKILGTSTYLYSVSIYDDKGKVIQVKSINITGGTDIATTQYSWAGQPLIMMQKQQIAGGGVQTSIVVTQTTYDDMGRVSKTEKKISNTLVNSNIMPAYKTIVQNEYDKLGQLKNKKLAPAYGSNAGLETEKFEYNIRGWLLGMNRDYLTDNINPLSNNYFGFELGYDKLTNRSGRNFAAGMNGAEFNGNINGMVWKSKGDPIRRKYDFEYDAANRLVQGDFEQNDNTSTWGNSIVNYSTMMGDGASNFSTAAYDPNGNIKKMVQYGLKLTGSSAIDYLNYSYQNTNSSNKLAKVTDVITGDNMLGDFKDGSNNGDDYGYDDNGNLISDANKKITSIIYNHLNLPSVITITGKGSITYTYDAAGNKLKKEVLEPGQTNISPDFFTTTSYIGGMVYESKVITNHPPVGTPVTDPSSYYNLLQFIGHEEGRIRFKAAAGTIPASFQYDYMLKDHLGNVRMVLTEEQQIDKYPVASLETAKLTTEQQYYTIDQSKIVDVVTDPVSGLPVYTNDNGIGNNPSDPTFESANSQKVYKLNGSTNKMGLGISLKVMAGDKLNVLGKSYYFQNNTGGTGVNSAIPVFELLTGLMGAPGGATLGGHTTATELNGITGVTNPLTNLFINDPLRNNAGFTQRPRAFINYVFLDEQFKYSGGGFSAVSNTPGLKDHFSELQNLTAPKNGYIYIYVSNESPVNVFFDNLQVVHTRGAILEETHYYPFGLVQAGISSKALTFGGRENKQRFNGYEQQNKEFSDGSGMEWYDYKNRFYDNQLGRFFCVDRLADQFPYYSPYQFAGNEPTVAIDLDGLEPAYIASKNKSGNTKLNMPVVAMYSRLYGNSFWQTGGKANLVIDQSIHDRITGYNTGRNGGGAITLGFEINYSGDYATNTSGEDWLKLTGHEIAHVQQFIDNFGSSFSSDKKYKEAVGLWIFAYGVDVAAKAIENRTTDPNKLHDKIEIEKGANKYENYFNTFFDSQNFSTTQNGVTTSGNKIIDLLQQMQTAQGNTDKKTYTQAFNDLMQLVDNFNKSQPKQPGH